MNSNAGGDAGTAFRVTQIGVIRSTLTRRELAPRQGYEGAPEAWVEITGEFTAGLAGIEVGQEVILLTWLHQADRAVLRVHPRGDARAPLAGVFATRSPDRPTPIGLHRVRVLECVAGSLRVAPLEAIHGTPVIDIKPVLDESRDA